MANLKQTADRYKSILKTMQDNRQVEALTLASDVTALIVNRLLNKGTGGDGKKFKGYSDNELPLFFFSYGNAPGKVESFKKKVKAKKTDPTYKNFRSHLGLPTDKRTHSLTGEMLASIRPEVTYHDELRTEVTIKSVDRLNQDKINWNSAEVGQSIIEMNKGDRAIVTAAQKERLKKLFTNQ